MSKLVLPCAALFVLVCVSVSGFAQVNAVIGGSGIGFCVLHLRMPPNFLLQTRIEYMASNEVPILSYDQIIRTGRTSMQ